MWRESAIRNLLLEDICHLPRPAEGEDEAGEDDDVDRLVAKARRRAGTIVGASWLALLVLFLLRNSSLAWLPAGGGEETVFTLGVLAVAVYSGFRLGQLEKLTAVARALDELRQRSGRS